MSRGIGGMLPVFLVLFPKKGKTSFKRTIGFLACSIFIETGLCCLIPG